MNHDGGALPGTGVALDDVLGVAGAGRTLRAHLGIPAFSRGVFSPSPEVGTESRSFTLGSSDFRPGLFSLGVSSLATK